MNVVFIQETGYYESLGVMYISAFLKRAGHTTTLLIACEEKDLIGRIRKLSPDLLAFSCTSDMHNWVIRTASLCKKHFRVPIIAGGAHPTCFPEFVENEPIDMVCQGEGEYLMLELVEHLKKGTIPTNMPGLWTKVGDKIYRNPVRPLIQEFSEFPLPDRDLYYTYGYIRDLPMKRFITGRGCPFNCAFCHNQLLKNIFRDGGTYVRKMPVEKIIGEILEVRKRYPLKNVHFSDDTFVLHRTWVMQFCEAYKRDVGLPFSCNIRVDLLDEKLTAMLADAGCRAVSVGLESGSEQVRNQILRKQITNDTVMKGVLLLKEHGIAFLTTNMIGVPGESEGDIWDTLTFNRKIRPTFTRCFIFDAFPGLPLTEHAIRAGHLPQNYSLEYFSAMSHEPIVGNINRDMVKNLSLLFFLLVRIPIPVPVLKVSLKLGSGKLVYLVGRIIQAYVEAKFFRLPLLPGIRYAYHIAKSFSSN